MKLLRCLPVILCTLLAGCHKSDFASPAEFTQTYADTLHAAHPELKVEITKDLQLKVTTMKGGDSTSFLDNAYNEYKQNPAHKADIIQKFVASGVGALDVMEKPIDRSYIVPIVKDRPWIEEMKQALIARGAKKAPETVFEEFCPGLVVVYAEDSPQSIRYLTPENMAALKLDRSELKGLALENLERLLPKIDIHGTEEVGVYMITAGGNYEASLLLMNSIWKSSSLKVKGEIVVAIPSRDLLLVTGSQNPQGLENVRKAVAKAMKANSYRLTDKLFVYRGGKFEEFK
jgi:uncharacterized protein YtpQ (UPF0354 family)